MHRGSGDFIEPPKHPGGNGDLHAQNLQTPVSSQSLGFPQSSLPQYMFAGHLQSINTHSRQAMGTLQGVRGHSPQPPGFSASSQIVPSTTVLPQAVSVTSQNLSRSGGSTSVFAAATPMRISPHGSTTVNVLQRQLSSPGILGMQSVGTSVGYHQQSLVSQVGTHGTVSFQDTHTVQQILSYPSTSSVSVSGRTIHHHGQSSSSGCLTPLTSTTQQSNLNLHLTQRHGSLISNSLTKPVLDATTYVPFTTTSNTGAPPRKKIKLEEKAPNTPEIAVLRKKILDYKHREMRELKENYVEHLTELFFLKNGGNIMDFSSAKKRPTFQLVQFLKSGNLDSDEDDEQENISEENKCAATMESSSNVSIATSLPSAVATVAQQGSSSVSSAVDPSYISVSNVPTATTTTVTPLSTIQSQPDCTPVTISASTVISQFSKSVAETKSSSQIIKNALSSPTITCQTSISRPPKSPTSPSQRLNTRQQAISAVYDSTIGSQEAIVERAKQEAQVMQRVAELRKEGMWSARRLPKVQEPPRNKAHWDYLLEEMQWLAADFAQERKWKKAAARKISRMVAKYHQEQEQKEIRAEKEEAQKLKRIAGQIAKQVKEFWANIEKVVQHKQQTRLDEKRKKALDIHLNFIVDQTEKYSSWLTEGLTGRSSVASSAVGSMPGTPEHSSTSGDDDFEPAQSETDDEETIEREEREAGFDETATQQELETLQQESEVPLEELLKTLPEDILEKPASLSSCEESDEAKEGDGEFHLEEEQADVEETIAEQENHERKIDHSKEIEELEAEGEMSLDELVKKYTGAYLSDLELEDQGSGDEEDEDYEDDDEDDDDLTSDDEDGTDNELEVGEEEEEDVKQTEEIGLEYLMHPEKEESFEKQMPATPEGKGPSKEITDIAAEAQSLQPKGYTLETTQVKVAVPFLLKHKLREYQHVGLDWLVTMHDKKLNGILADEMGLGKTIQTIALLAHLACETGVWGPHLIVVPTSVMLNWEMEFKKWCPAFKILTYYGNPKERKQKRQGWTKTNAFHVCITSYKLVIQDHQAFRRKKWKYFILDEAQNIKNFKSQRWQTLLNFQSQRRLLLTGTPLQNSLMELWSLMHFLMPNVFQSHREFKEWFSNPLSGMIEGSHEYNESLIKRLHKVLRPFLLRRLKDDVEKQMPKKYEHVIMCRLSKRQRFLYDEFMSLTKTKETLASGHFMSVINVLMQLRKVCNHPNLFDARPIISPFQTEGLVYFTASLVLRALESDPFKTVDLHCLYPSLSEMEQNLPKFVAERICKLQTSRSFIMEIDNHPEPLPRPKPTKLKPLLISRAVCPFVPAGRASPVTPISPALPPVSVVKHSLIKPVAVTPMPQVSPAAVPAATPAAAASVPIRIGLVSQQQPQQQSGQPQHLQAVLMSSAAVTNQRPSVPLSSIATSLPGVQATIQAKVLPQTLHGTAASSVIPSQPITVQIQQTDQGTRLMIPTGQLSQFSTGFIQIVQTSSGQQLIATSTPPVQSVIPMQTVTSTTSMPVVNGPARVSTVTASPVAVTTSIAAVPALVKTTPTVHLPITTAAAASGKPVMKVQPLSTELPSTSTVLSKTCIQQIIPSKIVAHEQVKQGRTVPVKLLKQATKSEFFLESLHQKRIHCKREKLDYIVRTNKKRCDMKPIYGQDLFDAVSITNNLKKNQPDQPWTGLGHFHCKCVHRCHLHSNAFWNQTEALQRIVHKPEQYLDELQHILERYVFVTPAVSAPCITMHVSHPPPSYLTENKYRGYILHTQLSPKAACLHKISANTTVQFPELRLIQYDCGKLQTMDVLLRKLKTEQHRVLIFTQMTKMLDVLEAFLNYHGHRYLRLDGTTKVEQRQALMERFNADKRIFCFILSTRSGGLGVNLTGADTVIFYDSDWNPTMDAQAQDRCHRIGQTRDVHIYRLISERTVEENILKKADQKRLLGDVAIEGGNFTTAYFKEHTIKDLFEEPSGLENLAKDKERRILKEETGNKDTSYITQLEQALCKAEDETDALAADLVKAEQKAELAEFDEDIPWDDKEAERKQEEEELSKAEQELAMLENELSPVERYAITFVETHMEPFCREELTIAGEDIEKVKKDWELTRLKALKEEEEIRAELEEDEMLFTYSRDDAYNQVYECEADQEPMPLWAPPTPPQDDNDVYIDQTMFFLYEPTTMPETQLPPVYIRKEHKRPKVETVTTRKQKQRKEEQPRVPRSLFDRPTAALLKMRREAKLQKLKHGLIKPYRPVSVVTNKQTMEPSQDHPEWLIHEDWALLQAVQTLLELTLNLTVLSPAHIANWELVADVVNSCSCVYRSPKQCKNRYENVIIPREEGRILYDVNPRKQKKTKGIYKTKNNRPMKTSQLYSQDSNVSVSMLYSVRFDAIKSMAAKRQPPMRQTVTSQNQKNPKHIAVLQDNGITFEQPLNPVQVATIRADRILREKKQSQAAAQASAEQQLAAQRSQPPPPTQVSQQTVVSHGIAQTVTAGQAQQLQSLSTAVSNAVMQTGTLTKADTVRPVMKSVSISSTKGGARNIVINTTGAATSNTFPTINKRMTQPISNVSQATTVAVTASLSPAVRAAHRQPTSLTVQDLTAVAGQAQTVLPTTAPSVLTSTSLAAMQMSNTQRIAAGTTTTAATVQQQLTQKGMSQQLQILKQQQQQQQIRNSKLQPLGVVDQLKFQQQMKRMQTQAQTVSGQKSLPSKIISGVVQVQSQKPATKTPVTRTFTETDMMMLKHRQQQAQKTVAQTGQQTTQTQGQTISTAQIIAQAQVQPVGQTATPTLVKTISAPLTSMPVPVSMTQPKGKTASVSHLQQQPVKQVQFQQLQQQKKAALQQAQKVQTLGQAQVTGKSALPLGTTAVQIIPSHSPKQLPLTMHQLNQIIKQQPQIITTVPTIIATVNQGQPAATHMVAKVSLASGSSANQIQTIPTTHVSMAASSAIPSTRSMGTPVAQTTAAMVKTTVAHECGANVQVHPLHTGLTQPAKITALTSAVVTQGLHQVQTGQISSASVQQMQSVVAHAGQTSTVVSVTPATQTIQHPTTVVTQSQPSIQSLAQQTKSSHYAMRTRNPQKH